LTRSKSRTEKILFGFFIFKKSLKLFSSGYAKLFTGESRHIKEILNNSLLVS